MTKRPRKKPAAKEEVSGEAEVTPEGEDAAENESTGTGGAQAAPDAPAEEPEADPEAQVAELNDKLLRVVAELENYRRRAERERQDTAKFAIAAFARDCLTVLDNLRRGLDSVSAEDRAGNQALETLAAGMELTERELITTLERHGIEKIDPLGEPFDYDRHQAMFEVEDEKQPAGTVVQVVQPGYMLNERLLRPAMVCVAKGGGKPDAADSTAGDDDTKAPSESGHGEGVEAGNDNQEGTKPSGGVEGDAKTKT
jgi:molecular chaperone GrpE